MLDSTAELLNRYIEKAKFIDKREDLKELNEHFQQLIFAETESPETEKLKKNIIAAVSHLVYQKEELFSSAEKRARLSLAEMSESEKVQQIIDKNLFTYHFQPIVRADNGEIYSYEALMRASNMSEITPFHILKYAEYTHRLSEIEQYTFLNVLRLIRDHEDIFSSKPVFINSMPNVKISDEKSREIEKLLGVLSDKVVVEMTESSEYDDKDLSEIKEKFSKLNIPIAIDDYGTGYSNINNLLRYTPNYVKIDRMLMNGIQNNPNKKHFVRDIIDFCHNNGILALAEGVENTDDLRTAILLGIDLIQGFYTARPSAEIITSIPYEIKAEIRSHQSERENGRRLKIHYAEKDEKISLERLSNDGFSCICIGNGYDDGLVSISGSPYIDTGIHLEITENYKGKIYLNNVRLSNTSDKPCIDLAKGSDAVIVLAGTNRLINSGIRVPEGARLTTEGTGNLEIKLADSDYYGIGNKLDEAHGDLNFNQDGTISITAESHSGVLIGAGEGGNISMNRGRYVFNAMGALSVAVGAVTGPTKIDMTGCDFECTFSTAFSTAIGSMYSDTDVHIIYSSVKCNADCQIAAGLGSLKGQNVKIHAESMSMSFDMNADALSVYGSLAGESDIKIERSSVKIKAVGASSIAFGALESGKTRITLTDIDISADLSTEMNACTTAKASDIHLSGGRFRIRLNGSELNGI